MVQSGFYSKFVKRGFQAQIIFFVQRFRHFLNEGMLVHQAQDVPVKDYDVAISGKKLIYFVASKLLLR